MPPLTLQSCILSDLLGITSPLKKMSERFHRGAMVWSRVQLQDFQSKIEKVAEARAGIVSTWPRQSDVGNKSTGQKLFGGRLLPKFHWEQVAYINLLEVRIGHDTLYH